MPLRWNPLYNKFDMTGTPSGENPVVALNGDTGQAEPNSSNEIDLLGGVGCVTSATGSTITVNLTGGGIDWIRSTGTTETLAVNTGYTPTNVALTTFTLPVTAAVGDVIKIDGESAAFYKVAQNASQTIHMLSSDTTTGVGGSITATNSYDCLTIRCLVANTDFIVENSMGNFNII